MKRKLLGILVFFTAVILGITAYFCVSDRMTDMQDVQSEQIVAANEIEQLVRMGKTEEAAAKAAKLQQSIRVSETGSKSGGRTLLLCAISLAFLFSVFGYIYFMILLPLFWGIYMGI